MEENSRGKADRDPAGNKGRDCWQLNWEVEGRGDRENGEALKNGTKRGRIRRSKLGGRGSERKRGREGGGRREVEQREQRENTSAIYPEGENEQSQTNRPVRRVCPGVVSRVQSKLSRAIQARRGNKPLQELRS